MSSIIIHRLNDPADNDGHWGIRIESALLVARVRPRNSNNGDSWLGFQRLTVVPIQAKMIRENMLNREEIAWVKVRSSLHPHPGDI